MRHYSMKTDKQLEQISIFAQKKLAHDKTGHSFSHIQRVSALAKKLAHEEKADTFITLASALLHDTIDDKVVADSQQALTEVKHLLALLEVSPEKVAIITYIITHMSFANSLNGQEKLPLEGQIVQDADWLDAMGAIGITRAIYYGGHHAETIYDPTIKPRTNLDKTEYRNLANETIINHFHEKLFHLKDMLNTEGARKLAQHRDAVMHAFLDEFTAEWNAKR